jgi:uncharacterized protein DUF4157
MPHHATRVSEAKHEPEGLPPAVGRHTPAAAPPHPILAVQKLAGNQATGRWLQTKVGIARSDPLGPVQRKCATCEEEEEKLQAKLSIGQPGDVFEQEADRIADQVVRMPDARVSDGAVSLQPGRECAACEEQEIQRKEDRNVTGLRLMRKRSAKQTVTEMPISSVVNAPGQPIDRTTRNLMEMRFGRDFSDVRIHADARADESARAVNALAYTMGRNLVFASGEYAPATPTGLRLLAHELVHVVQQGAAPPAVTPMPAVRRHPVVSPTADFIPAMPTILRMARTDRQYTLLAREVHDAIYRLGTDEERVYRALQELDRDPTAIAEFMEAYRRYVAEVEKKSLSDLPPDLLIKDIEDDFSGSELEFALQLLNRGTKGSKQEIEPTAQTSRERLEADAKRLWDAVETIWGTDEEAIYATLLPYGRDQGKLQGLREAYRKISKGEDLETRILDEMSGSELDYAIYLLFDPKRAYEYYLKQASENFSSLILGGLSTGGSCADVPEEAFDKNYWTKETPGGRDKCALLAKAGDRPSQAITELFEYVVNGHTKGPGSWRFDCAEWVQIHHLYAMLKLMGPYRFDLQFGSSKDQPREFWLKQHRSTGLSSTMLYARKETAPFRLEPEELAPTRLRQKATSSDDYEIDPNGKPLFAEEVLKRAPVGSRVMWTNLYLQKEPVPLGAKPNSMTNENTIKLGDDSYGAHGFARVFPPRAPKVFTRAELEANLAEEGKDGGMSTKDAIEKYIVIREIEYYSTVADQPWEKVATEPPPPR